MADELEGISKIEGVGRKGMQQTQKVSPQDLDHSTVANQDHFEELMAQERKKQDLQAQEQAQTDKNSLIDEVTNLQNKTKQLGGVVRPDDLIAQAKDAIAQIEDIRGKLATPNLEVKPSVQNLLKRKLTHIDDNLKVALDRAGIEYKDITKQDLQGISNPIERFLGMLADGQGKLDRVTSEISAMDPKSIQPTDLLTMQVKLNFVQQELEFFTNLLNKSLESTKTMMNVQV